MKRICILTFEGNPITAELVSSLKDDYEVFVICTKDERFSVKGIFDKKRGFRWFWYNHLFVRYAKKYNQTHEPKPSWNELVKQNPERFYVISSYQTDESIKILEENKIDLGVIIGTPLLKKALLDTPSFGMINLHQGRIPDYRGKPPAYWEHENKEPVMHVTVHRAICKLDAGEILAEDIYSIKEHAHWIVSKFKASFVSRTLIEDAIKKVFNNEKGELREIKYRTRTVPNIGRLLRDTLRLFKGKVV